MEEIEAPTEQAQDDINEHAHHSAQRWVLWVALSSALLAALAAVTVLLAGHHANEAMIIQQQSSDKWNEYQAKRLKSLVISSKDELLAAQGKPISSEDQKYLDRHHEEEKDLQNKAKELAEDSEAHMSRHQPLAIGVTMFQVAIAIGAISVLSKRPSFWFVSLGFGAIGVIFLIRGLV